MQSNLNLKKFGKRTESSDEIKEVSCNDNNCYVGFTYKFAWFDPERENCDYDIYDKGTPEYFYYKNFLNNKAIDSIKYEKSHLFCNHNFCSVYFTVRTSSFGGKIKTTEYDLLSYYRGSTEYNDMKNFLGNDTSDL